MENLQMKYVHQLGKVQATNKWQAVDSPDAWKTHGAYEILMTI